MARTETSTLPITYGHLIDHCSYVHNLSSCEIKA